MDLTLVKELLALMDESGLTELHYAQGDTEVRLSRKGEPAQVVAAPITEIPAQTASTTQAEGASEAPVAEGKLFTSPMVGTFYGRPNPDSDPFVKVGDRVSKTDVVCILEAMKVFNEIHGEFDGTVTEILVADGDAVEFDQPLFRYE